MGDWSWKTSSVGQEWKIVHSELQEFQITAFLFLCQGFPCAELYRRNIFTGFIFSWAQKLSKKSCSWDIKVAFSFERVSAALPSSDASKWNWSVKEKITAEFSKLAWTWLGAGSSCSPLAWGHTILKRGEIRGLLVRNAPKGASGLFNYVLPALRFERFQLVWSIRVVLLKGELVK